jgi:hypothetical protein
VLQLHPLEILERKVLIRYFQLLPLQAVVVVVLLYRQLELLAAQAVAVIEMAAVFLEQQIKVMQAVMVQVVLRLLMHLAVVVALEPSVQMQLYPFQVAMVAQVLPQLYLALQLLMQAVVAVVHF